jgi:predicted CXXCH cytochrome family protein
LRRILEVALISTTLAIMVLLIFILRADAQSTIPSIPHGQAGFEKCLDCHASSGVKPQPADHASFSVDSCLSCHTFAAASSTPMATPGASLASDTRQSGDDYCLSCHAQKGLSETLGPDTLSLYVDADTLAASVHGNKLFCADCHTSYSTYPHPKISASSARAFSVAQYELCKQCHFANYTKSLDSVHYQVLAQGTTSAPLCTDCHGAHNVTKPDQPRSKISITCSKCHQDVFNQYVQSVHGQALMEANNYDVPVCTDCHPSHKIEDPRTAVFRNQSVDLCSNCHANAALMKKYAISTNVVQSYLQDFHGATVALMGKQGKDIWTKTAVCTDCHGVHDIKPVSDPESKVIKANLVATCAQCHPDINTNFPGAWLSHYEPSLSKAPLVFATEWFYRIIIPFIIAGLLAHILIDIWRALTNR